MSFLLIFSLAILACLSESKTTNEQIKKGLVESTGSYSLDGSMVGARLRCEGYLCPQWALDISRYDVIHYLDQPFQYTVQELLPLAPTVERSFNVYTTFDPATRLYTVAASDYPEVGIDSFWTSKINEAVNGSSPVISYKLIPHPDASTNNPGNLHLARILSTSNGRIISIFGDGSIFEVDINNQKYVSLGSLFSKEEDRFTLTYAHVIDGSVLKSFVTDKRGASFLITTDLSASPVTASTPLYITPIKGELGKETPLHAFMITVQGVKNLLVITTGNFDAISFVDETTGVMQPQIANLYDAQEIIFECNESVKDCDYWQTATLDPVTNTLYYQAHYHTTEDDIAGIYAFQFLENRVTKQWYPYTWPSTTFMQFGYLGYEWVQFTDSSKK